MRKIKIKAIYRHFKGDYYLVEDVALDSETLEEIVVYRQLYGEHRLFTRKLSMFMSPVDKQKYPQCQQSYRFEECVIPSVKEQS